MDIQKKLDELYLLMHDLDAAGEGDGEEYRAVAQEYTQLKLKQTWFNEEVRLKGDLIDD